jgi:hypothetical protein
VYIDAERGRVEPAYGYKAIIRSDHNTLISIVHGTYELVPNRKIIKPLMEQLSRLDSKWSIDESNSFVTDARMRLQVTFPELTFSDGESDIALSLYLHNSYDGTEGVKMLWGAIRWICSNGMVFGKVLGKFRGRHIKSIRLDDLKEQVEQTYEQIPAIRERISILQHLAIPEKYAEAIENEFGKRALKHINEQPRPENQWLLYNQLTYFISHQVAAHRRAEYQMRVSRMFEL